MFPAQMTVSLVTFHQLQSPLIMRGFRCYTYYPTYMARLKIRHDNAI